MPALEIKWMDNPRLVLLYFFLVNMPLISLTSDTFYWSDDFQYIHLMWLKSQFSPVGSLLLQPTGGHREGGHFAPVYNLFNICVSSVSLHPVFFHFIVLGCYILTAYFVFLIARLYYRDSVAGILAGTLFAVNYYAAFRALTWNCFHSHATNTLTGTMSLYYLLHYFENRKIWALGMCVLLFALTILNYESGFVFLPVLGITALYYLIEKRISLKKFLCLALMGGMLASLFPLGSRIATGKAVPLSYRFQWSRDVQNYIFQTNELFFKSIGMAFPYNKFIFNNLKNNLTLKEPMIRFLRYNDKKAVTEIPQVFIVIFIALFLCTVAAAIFLLVLILSRIRPATRLFLFIFCCLYFIYIFIFYRSDVANAMAMFSSIILADCILALIRDQRRQWVYVGRGILALYAAVTTATIMDRFDDCYQKSFGGIQKIAMMGPQKIYDEINQKIGRFVQDGFIIFIHDYTAYERTGGFQRIGLLLNAQDFASYNATVFRQDFLRTDWVKRFRHKSLMEFSDSFGRDERHKKIIIFSRDEALAYLKNQHIDLKRIEAIYISPVYGVERLNEQGIFN